jgi:DNA-binding MarR family transcriptional regulator
VTLFAELVRELDSPHVAKQPTRTFRAVLAALDELGHASVGEIRRHAGTQWNSADMILQRLRRYGCATPTHRVCSECGSRAKEWTITDQGRILARDLAQEH